MHGGDPPLAGPFAFETGALTHAGSGSGDSRSDLVLTTGRQFMRFHEKNLPLKTFKVPIAFPAMRFYRLWHERVHHAPEHKWLRELISATAKTLLVR